MTTDTTERRKNWNILIPYYFDALSDIALQEGIALSKVFQTGLILFNCNLDESYQERLAKLAAHIITNHGVRTECFVPKGNQTDLMFALAHKTESILIVIGHNKKNSSLQHPIRKTLRVMRRSRTPFLMVPDAMHNKSFSNIVYCMGYQKQEKEKILWASYFGRIYKSRIHIVMPEASDQFFKTGIRSNVQAMNKLYMNAEVSYQVVPSKANIHKAPLKAIEYSAEIQAGAFIILTTLRPDIFDFFGGSDDLHAIRNNWSMPVLCINPRDDLYVLCN